jgi:hypothetical protein
MKYALAVAALLAAIPAAHARCALCALGAVVNGANQPYYPPPQYYAPAPVPQYQPPQFHSYNFQGRQLNCMTIGNGSYAQTRCN